MKKTGIIAFTEHGCVLGEKLLRDLQKQDQEVYGFVKSKYVELPEKHPFRKVKGTLREWAEEWIPRLDGIIFFSATGIAVRTIAPFVVSKKTDPAVVVIDEQGSYAISLLSGHLGGANELTEFAAESIGAQPVITTGTDVNHTFAVDVFARKNNLVISDMGLAKEMAALLIRGKTIAWGAGEGFIFPKEQTIPEQLRFRKTESRMGNRELYGLQSHKVTENRKKPWEQSRLGCFICIRKMCISGWVAGKTHRKKRSKHRFRSICQNME